MEITKKRFALKEDNGQFTINDSEGEFVCTTTNKTYAYMILGALNREYGGWWQPQPTSQNNLTAFS